MKILPEKPQLTRFNIKFGCVDSPTVKFDNLQSVRVSEFQLSRFVEHFGHGRDIIYEF